MFACTETSRADVGSSQTISCGLPANERAMATRCLSPPESCVGFTLCNNGSTLMSLSNDCARSSAVSLDAPVSFWTARETMRVTEWRRFSAESGFWKTICTAPTSAALRSFSVVPRVLPLSATEPPASLAIMPSNTRARVVLPEPDSPTKPSVSPA